MFYRTRLPRATGPAAESWPSAPAGMLVTPVSSVASPSGRAGAGEARWCAARPAPGQRDQAVLWHPVAVAPVKVKRDGSVLVDAWVPGVARLGVLEEAFGPGTIEALCARYGLVVRRRRLLSPAFVVRCVLAAALMPEDWIEVQLRLAGLLAGAPLARPWHPVGAGDLARYRRDMPVALFRDLFWRLAGPIDDGSGPGLRWRGLLVCATDGFLTRSRTPRPTARTSARRGPATIRAVPQAQAQIVCVAGNRAALGAAWGPASDGEQTLIWRLAGEHPEVFAPGRVIIFDRLWPGAELVAAIARLGAHVICRLKSGLDFPIEGPCGDGSHATHLDTAAGPLPARLVDYALDTATRWRAGGSG